MAAQEIVPRSSGDRDVEMCGSRLLQPKSYVARFSVNFWQAFGDETQFDFGARPIAHRRRYLRRSNPVLPPDTEGQKSVKSVCGPQAPRRKGTANGGRCLKLIFVVVRIVTSTSISKLQSGSQIKITCLRNNSRYSRKRNLLINDCNKNATTYRSYIVLF